MSELLWLQHLHPEHKTSNLLWICKDIPCLNLDISLTLKALCVQVSPENSNPFEVDTLTRLKMLFAYNQNYK